MIYCGNLDLFFRQNTARKLTHFLVYYDYYYFTIINHFGENRMHDVVVYAQMFICIYVLYY